MTEPRKCPEPGCGQELYQSRFHGDKYWFCPATDNEHLLAALRARNAELEAQLDEAHKREVVLREAVLAYVGDLEDPRIGWCGHGASTLNHFKCERCWQEDLDSTAIPHTETCTAARLVAVLTATSESATAWLKAHDREVLEKFVARLTELSGNTGELSVGVIQAALRTQET